MSDAETITRALGGRWFGHYGTAYCPAHENKRTPALSLKNGGDGRLLACCHAGCDFQQIIGALRGLGLVDGHRPAFTPDPARDAERHEAEKAERERGIGRARSCWSDTMPIGGTLAERYLRGRGIRCALPPSLRFAAECWHGASAKRLPAMVAAVRRKGELVGVHRTYLQEPGARADVEPAKAMLGPCRGGAVCLSDGAGPLVVSEGIETGLSLVDALQSHQPNVWAALSTSGIVGLVLPAEPGQLVIAPDDDEAGRKAADKLARRAHGTGWRVRIMQPPSGGDWNDVTGGIAA